MPRRWRSTAAAAPVWTLLIQEIIKRPADHLFHSEMKHLRHLGVHEGSHVIFVDDPDPLQRGLDDCPVLFLALPQRLLGQSPFLSHGALAERASHCRREPAEAVLEDHVSDPSREAFHHAFFSQRPRNQDERDVQLVAPQNVQRFQTVPGDHRVVREDEVVRMRAELLDEAPTCRSHVHCGLNAGLLKFDDIQLRIRRIVFHQQNGYWIRFHDSPRLTLLSRFG